MSTEHQGDRKFVQHAREAAQRAGTVTGTQQRAALCEAVRTLVTLAEHIVIRLEQLERSDA